MPVPQKKFVYTYNTKTGTGELEIWARDKKEAIAILRAYRMFSRIFQDSMVEAPSRPEPLKVL